MERKLASIQKILKVEPIVGADKIEKITVLGWTCVAKKGEFKVGDFCVYFEIDSMIPKNIWSEFLWKEGDTKEKYRLKTVKMKGQISQGLVLPISILGQDTNIEGNYGEVYHEGDDISELLGVEKYIHYIPAHLQGDIEGDFPFFIPKTDETRIQTFPQLLEICRDQQIYITEKLDGTSATYYLKDNHFGVCSRNIELKDGENLYWQIARKYDIQNKLQEFYKQANIELAIQGEIIGQGVQSNKYKLEDHQFYVFNVYNISENRYLNYREFIDFCFISSLIHVPLLKYDNLLGNIEDWVEISKGQSVLCKETKREGIVVRGIEEEIIPNYGRFSFKVINPEFLLKYGE